MFCCSPCEIRGGVSCIFLFLYNYSITLAQNQLKIKPDVSTHYQPGGSPGPTPIGYINYMGGKYSRSGQTSRASLKSTSVLLRKTKKAAPWDGNSEKSLLLAQFYNRARTHFMIKSWKRELHQPRRLPRQVVVRPAQKTLCIIFLKLSPPRFFEKRKRVFLVGSRLSLAAAFSTKRLLSLQGVRPTCPQLFQRCDSQIISGEPTDCIVPNSEELTGK